MAKKSEYLKELERQYAEKHRLKLKLQKELQVIKKNKPVKKKVTKKTIERKKGVVKNKPVLPVLVVPKVKSSELPVLKYPKKKKSLFDIFKKKRKVVKKPIESEKKELPVLKLEKKELKKSALKKNGIFDIFKKKRKIVKNVLKFDENYKKGPGFEKVLEDVFLGDEKKLYIGDTSKKSKRKLPVLEFKEIEAPVPKKKKQSIFADLFKLKKRKPIKELEPLEFPDLGDIVLEKKVRRKIKLPKSEIGRTFVEKEHILKKDPLQSFLNKIRADKKKLYEEQQRKIEEKRKAEEERRRVEEEQRRVEEERRRVQEEKRKAEEESRRVEEEKIRVEEERNNRIVMALKEKLDREAEHVLAEPRHKVVELVDLCFLSLKRKDLSKAEFYYEQMKPYYDKMGGMEKRQAHPVINRLQNDLVMLRLKLFKDYLRRGRF